MTTIPKPVLQQSGAPGEQQTHATASADAPQGEQALMDELRITYDGRYYHHAGLRYMRLEDATRHALARRENGMRKAAAADDHSPARRDSRAPREGPQRLDHPEDWETASLGMMKDVALRHLRRRRLGGRT